MPKQLRLKFKKILKQAEFVHADLEYHEQLVPEAKQLFFDSSPGKLFPANLWVHTPTIYSLY